MYGDLADQIFRVPIRVAEAAKYVDNAFHALKVGFANEVGALSVEFGIDSHQLMEIFKADRKLNISEAYLTPGFCFGGSCLPKDLRALVHRAKGSHVDVPILESVLQSNEAHFRRTYDLLTANGRRRIGLFGLAFKPGTDELRESPFVELAERLIGKGYDLRIYDPSIHLPSLTGTNREYIEEHLPHLKQLLAETAGEVVEHAETCIVASRHAEVGRALEGADGRHDHRPGPAARHRRARAERRVPRCRLVGRSSSSRTCRSRSTGGCGRSARRSATPATRSRSSARRAASQDREPYALIDGVEIHRYPLDRGDRRVRPGTCASTRRRSGAPGASLAASAGSTSSTSATRPTCCSSSRCR